MRARTACTRICLAGALTACLAAPVPAHAQQVAEVALDRFEPAPAGDRMFGVESPYAAGDGVPHVMLLTDYAHDPYVLHHGPGFADVGAVVGDQMIVHLNASVAIRSRINLNFDVPAAMVQDGTSPTSATTTYASPRDAAFGDVRLGVRVNLYGARDAPFQLAVSGYVWVPSGADKLYLSDGKVRGMPSIIAGGRGRFFEWSFASGIQIRPRQAVDTGIVEGTSLQIGGGFGFVLAGGKAQIGPEIRGSFVLSPLDRRTTGAELGLDARYRLFDDFEIGLGAGPGLTSGFGTPDVRVVGMLAFTPEVKK